MKRRVLLAVVAAAVVVLGIVVAVKWPAGGPSTTGLRRITFQLDWVAETTFVGVYRAKERLVKEGIDLVIVEGKGADLSAQTVGAGASGWIGISSAPATAINRSNGVPVKTVAVLYQYSNSVIYSLERKPIRTPRDLVGKTIGLVPGSVTVAEYEALLKVNNIDRSTITEVTAGFDPSPLLSGKIDALMTYGESTPVELRAQGLPIVTMAVKDFGVKMYAMNIIVNDRATDEEKDAIESVVRAILAEYDWVRSDPQAAADYFLEMFPERDAKYVQESLKVVASFLGTGQVGKQTREGWTDTIKLLRDAGLLGDREVRPETVTVAGYLSE